MMSYQVTRNAYSCLEDILLTDSKSFTKRHKAYVRKIYKAFEDLASSEMVGDHRPELHDDTYSYRIKDHLVYYRQQKQDITILGVFHYSVDPTQTKKKRHAKPKCESGSLFTED